MQLYCVAHAGSSAMNFLKWKSLLDNSISVVPLELAGRGIKHNQVPYRDFSEAVQDIFNDFKFDNADQETKYNNKDIGLDLRSLEDIGLIKRVRNTQIFRLTERAYYLRIGWKQEKVNNIDNNLKSKIDNFHILLFLNKNQS